MIKITELDLTPLRAEQDLSNNEEIEFTDTINFVETSQPDVVAKVIENKHQQIAELEKQLEEKEKIIQMQQNIERYDIGEMLTENTKLKQQIKFESDARERFKRENQQLKQSQKQLAIEELERVQVQCQFDITFADYEQEQRLYDYINNRIKSLKGEK